jgi:peptide/nickel transport system permease protein
MKKRKIFKKIIYAAITVFAVLVFNYILFRVLPGDPLAMMMRNPKATPEMIEATKQLFGLDKPWYVQFYLYFKNMFAGDLGMSFFFKQPVSSIIGARIMPTIIMVGLAEVMAIIMGIFLGIIAAWKRGTKIDIGTLGFSLITYSMPTFWLGIVMVVVFSVNLHLFPTSGILTPGMTYSATSAMVADYIRHLMLPMLTLSIVLIGEYALTMRNTLIDVLSEDYITTAKAKGFGNSYILRMHALPNAMLPMVTIIAINLGLVVGGTVQVETIFSWPGLGSLMYEALRARDYPLLQGVFLLVTVSVVVANLIADITYSYIDPRVKD